MAEVISLDDVYIALSSSKPTLYKAIVSLILSSSINASIISKLTLYDFLYAGLPTIIPLITSKIPCACKFLNNQHKKKSIN